MLYDKAGWRDDNGKTLVAGLPAREPVVPAWREIVNERLYWSDVTPDGTAPPDRRVKTVKGTLERFIAIRSGAGVLRFFDDYGPLQLCKHGLVFTHGWTADGASGCYPVGEDSSCDPDLGELLLWWYWHAGRARALLEIAALRAAGKLAPRAAWERLYVEVPPHVQAAAGAYARYRNRVLERAPRDRGFAQMVLMNELNQWAALGMVRPAIRPDGEQRATLELSGTTFGLIGLQLMTRAAGADYVVCDGCQQPYQRERAPKAGQRNFCPECRSSGADVRFRMRQSREKAREARRLKGG